MKSNWGKVYAIVNPDFPDDCYVGSTSEEWTNKRLWRHKQRSSHPSYGRLFSTPNFRLIIVEMSYGVTRDELGQRERYYYDKFDANNVNVPWRSPEEKKELSRIYMKNWRLNQKLKGKSPS